MRCWAASLRQEKLGLMDGAEHRGQCGVWWPRVNCDFVQRAGVKLGLVKRADRARCTEAEKSLSGLVFSRAAAVPMPKGHGPAITMPPSAGLF